jgi:hypothetical protein
MIPEPGVIAALLNPNNPDAESQSRELQAAARALGEQTKTFNAINDAEIDAAYLIIASVSGDNATDPHTAWPPPGPGAVPLLASSTGPKKIPHLTVMTDRTYCSLNPTKTLESGHFLVRWLQQGAPHQRRCSAMVAILYEGGRPTAGAGYRMARTCCRDRRPS